MAAPKRLGGLLNLQGAAQDNENHHEIQPQTNKRKRPATLLQGSQDEALRQKENKRARLDDAESAVPAHERQATGGSASIPSSRHSNSSNVGVTPQSSNPVDYNKRLTKIEKSITGVCEKLVTVLASPTVFGRAGKQVEQIAAQVQAYRTPSLRYPKNDKAVAVGPMGSGKSSLVNCIVEQQDVAPSSDSNQRGTNVSHRYSRTEPGQVSPFRADALYYKNEQIEAHVAKRCKRIFDFLIMEALGDAEEEIEGDLNEMQEAAEHAMKYFHIVLRKNGSGLFDTPEDVEEFFRDRHESSSLDETVEVLMRFMKNFKSLRNLSTDIEKHEIGDTDALNGFYETISMPSEDSKEPHPWPLVRSLDVKLHAQVFATGLSLCDTPGINDSDPDIVARTTTEMHAASVILVTMPLLRNSDNPALDDILKHCIRLRKEQSTYLVLTKIDHKDDPKPKDLKALEPHARTILEEIEQKSSELVKEQARLTQRKDEIGRKATTFDRQANLNNVEKQLREVGKSIEAAKRGAKLKAFQLVVEHRNNKIEADLKERFRKLTWSNMAPDLKVIFVSSSEYQKHLQESGAARLSREGTGIPALQRILYRIPIAGRLDVLKRICSTELPTLLNRVIGGLSKTRLQMKNEIRTLVDDMLRECDQQVEQTAGSLRRLFERFNEHAYNEENENSWKKAATKLLRAWERYQVINFLKFCQQKGIWKQTKDKHFISWNEMLQTIMAKDVAKAFDSLRADVENVRIQYEDRIKGCFSRLNGALREHEGYHGLSSTEEGQCFHDVLKIIQDALTQSSKTLFDDLKVRLSEICTDATVTGGHDESDSFLASHMRIAYESAVKVSAKAFTAEDRRLAKAQKGKGGPAHHKRVQIIRDCVLGVQSNTNAHEGVKRKKNANGPPGHEEAGPPPSIFRRVCNSAQEALDEALNGEEGFEAQLAAKVKTSAEQITADFDLRFSMDGQEDLEDEEQHPEAVSTLLAAAREALETLSSGTSRLLKEFEEAW